MRAVDDVSLQHARERVLHAARPVRLRQDHAAAADRRLRYPTDGEILLYGEDIAPLPPFKRPVNTVFQSYALFPHMTVAQNIGFGLEMLGKPKAEIDARVAEMLKLVRMEELTSRRTSQISGGQQQRVALARALAPAARRCCCSTSRCRRSTTSSARKCRSS